jgi:hypothetical protein
MIRQVVLAFTAFSTNHGWPRRNLCLVKVLLWTQFQRRPGRHSARFEAVRQQF